MKRIIIALSLCLIATGANSFWQSRQQVSIGGAPPAYTGPGDVAGWSGAYGYWGLRCYNAAYAGNVADVWDKATGVTTHTLLTCSAGTVNQTINSLATTCAVACVVKQLYDQVGTQHLTTPTGGCCSNPDLVLNIVGGLPAMFFDGDATSTMLTSASAATTQAQPLTVAGIIRFNTNTGVRVSFTDGTFAFDPLLTISAGGVSQSFGSRIDYTGVADNSFASLISVANSASSSMSINGTITSGGDPGSAGIGSTNKLTMGAGTDSGAAFFLGYVYEIIVKAGAVSTTDQASMTANQRAIGTGF